MSGKYLAARDAFGAGGLSWTGDSIMAQLVSAQYQFRETDTKVSGAIGEPVRVSGRDLADGWTRAGAVTFRAVKGPPAQGVVFFRADGLLIFYADAVQGFPMTPNGGDIEVEILEPGIFRV